MRALVTGGGGFVGAALCRRLRDLGHDVTALGRRPYPALAAAGIRTVVHDLAVTGAATGLTGLLAGVECVFHTAAHVKMWGPREAFVRGNIGATESVIAACRAAGVARLVFTSSPSVVAAGHDLRGIDESQPSPSRSSALYPQTKAAAERAVLQAHGAGLRTIALRPHLIFGPGDTNLVPTILERARAGRLVQVGDGTNLVDLTFIDDCVAAHVRAAVALEENPGVGGRPYFISQGTPVPLWEWIGRVLALHDMPPVRRRIPAAMARVLATAAETVWWTLHLSSDPPLTRFLAEEMSTDHYFNINAARRELGYEPSCTVWEATERSFGRAAGTRPTDPAPRTP
ncbi:MAG: NAD-dependent epimerase/dehydratase family protein [Planctomycetota bacterium]|nr:MAG: NAD-dependent epimerase/dehydratase family protein [Planctomycetota bacterium]